jgi:hypothetical protein
MGWVLVSETRDQEIQKMTEKRRRQRPGDRSARGGDAECNWLEEGGSGR